MKPSTLAIIETTLTSDETLSSEETRTILKKLHSALPEHKPRPGTIKDAAKILDVHPVTVRRYAKAGLLTPIRITARKVRYDLNEVEKLAQTGIDLSTVPSM